MKTRIAALWHSGCGVSRTKVIFDDESAYWMDSKVYDAIPLGTKATLEDYQKLGQVDKAEERDIYSNK